VSGAAVAAEDEAPTPHDGAATPVIAPTEAAGWFGKLPMLGDFASRRLPAAFVSACDAWLSQSIGTSREQLGTGWLDAYLTAPLWRFAWASGVIDTQWWFGVLMPSVDAVGRYFPLMIAAARKAPPTSADALGQFDDWIGHHAAAALDTLQDGATLDAFENALAGAPAWPELHDCGAALPVGLPGRQRCQLAGQPSLQRWAVALASSALLERCAGHSLWWPLHGTPGEDSVSLCAGLPAPEQFAMLLDGTW
jgi:type VI secretion system protein ImpM